MNDTAIRFGQYHYRQTTLGNVQIHDPHGDVVAIMDHADVQELADWLVSLAHSRRNAVDGDAA